MDVTLTVRRFDPEASDPKPYLQDYELAVDDTASVLDGLIKVPVHSLTQAGPG